MAASFAQVPVTKLERVSGTRVRVTAEYPLPSTAGWLRVEYYQVPEAQPKIGALVKVTIEHGD